METAYLNTPIGVLEIKGNNEGLHSVIFKENNAPISESIPEVLLPAVTQLKEYFNRMRTDFDLKLSPEGTTFQKRVWEKLLEIPFGRTTSYQKMANNLGDPKVIRAAASANGKNPISIIIPCHRVIGSDGSLTGYAGGLHRKKWLLEHESPVKQGELF
ncbi:methylated-DNA--[protein]-cysteine S-methyltransferase [Aureisphaera galaxeae]|uniref:methylated-DNA--[protein]-cysteine S-methyltransferase n=1 Tax=Aureisphaera galaxeae TaxID=1538023 RepID=UPI002350669E|nr:methylated-DNA--[protein]-cysteine S-methyltransferase [Aureisphaera galaxeae]MDC8002426.1 methylated-DNA--[protein]-cysteine S-methyltransferase [Aureisphaera galaxeae]